ncbi:class A sortase [Candidatus Enterococcus ferrettii]|uniref:Sortase A n=1 Tax=Candidatus Enterococcus ferrettii TaxID=2815324 RepID=A0ABV0EX99_9ENTE|nr:class A sortase [Enterococcus sp. 665A]
MKKIVKVLPAVWLLLGMLTAGAGFCGYRLLLNDPSDTQQQTHRILEPAETDEQRNKKNKQATFDPNAITPVTPGDYAEAQLHYETIVDQYGVGAIYIPSAELKTKILAGLSNQNLMVGVGTYRENQKLGAGNYAVFAHNLVQGGGALGRLSNAAMDSTIYATDFSRIYEYKVILNQVVDQTRGDLLDEPTDSPKPVITLIRCEGGLNTTKRAAVQGEFIGMYAAKYADKSVQEGLGIIHQVTPDATERAAENGSEEQETSTKTTADLNQSSKQPLNRTRYSWLQRGCIRMFQVISNDDVFLVGVITYALVMLYLTAINIKTTKNGGS